MKPIILVGGGLAAGIAWLALHAKTDASGSATKKSALTSPIVRQTTSRLGTSGAAIATATAGIAAGIPVLASLLGKMGGGSGSSIVSGNADFISSPDYTPLDEPTVYSNGGAVDYGSIDAGNTVIDYSGTQEDFSMVSGIEDSSAGDFTSFLEA